MTKNEFLVELNDLRKRNAELEAREGELRLARKAFERSEMLLCKAFNTIPDLVAIIDMNYRILISNWHGGYEYVPEEARSGNPVCHKVYYGRKTPCKLCHVREVFRTGRPVIREKRNPKIGQVEIHAFPIVDESGNVALVMEHIRNITAQKQAEKELKKANLHAERLLRFSDALLSAIPIPVFYKDNEGRYLGCNRAFTEMMGVTSEQIKGKTVLDIWPSEFDKVYQRKDIKLMNNPVRQVNEIKVRDKVGIDRTVMYAKDVYCYENGEVAGMVGAFLDISERKEAEERLRQAKQEWERTFDAIVDPVMIADVHHRIIKANKAMADKLGISPADAEGLVCYNAVHGAGEPPLFCPHSELLADGQPHSVEIYEKLLGGYFIVSVSPLFNLQGEVYGSVHYVRDITERKKAEDHLKESEIRFKTIFDNTKDGLIVADIESKQFVLGNSIICRMLGYEEEELKRMNVRGIHPSEDLPHVFEQFEKLARGEMTIAEKIAVKRKDGTLFYADINTSHFTLDGKECLLGAFRDVTDRERAKDALRDSEQKLKAIVYGSPIPQFVIDHGHRVIYWNDALAELTGIKADEMIGTKDQWRAFYPAERFCMADLLLEGTIENVNEMYGGKYNKSSLVANAYEAMDLFPTLGKDGKWLQLTAAEIKDARGKVIGVVETLEDVTERKLAEESVRRLNEELERKVDERTRQLLDAREELVRKEKLAVLGQLSGSVGHELRNPLGVMNNAVYFLKTVMADADETLMEYLDIIKHEIDNSQRIISDLLDFARTKTPQKRAVMVRELMKESLGRCAVPENVVVKGDIPDKFPPLNVDPLQMVQVFQNLISNAVQAMPEGGELRISARKNEELKKKTASLEPRTSNLEPGFIEISVADTSEGISPENMNKLFQPLFTTKDKGIGLGLTVCRNLTEANGGSIEVKSELGKGTTFTIKLPTEG
jgi:PAS domain S-box-containing protein